MASDRYRIVKLRGGWAVEDRWTGAIWTGLAYAGAVVLASHLNGMAG
jgi:hypothetical protein